MFNFHSQIKSLRNHIMLSKNHKKLRLEKAQLSQTNLQTKKARTFSKMELKHQGTNQIFNKKNCSKVLNSLTLKSQKSKSKTDNPLCLGKNQHKTEKKSQRNRNISQLSTKQREIRQTKSMQNNQMKYIFNSIPKNRVKFVSNTSEPRNSNVISYSKSHSNLTLTKQLNRINNDMLSSFGKTNTSDFSKIKKKKHDYIKKFNKTSSFQKSISSGFQTIDCIGNTNMPMTNIDITTFSEDPSGLQKQAIGFLITDKDLENIRTDNKVPKISQIRQNVSTLFKKLKSTSKAKLLLISNNYEKIVSNLYKAIKRPNLPNCQISRINTNSSGHEEKQNKKPVESANKSTYVQIPFPNARVLEDIICFEESSEHWDSYMNLNSEQFRSIEKIKKENKKEKVVKKLDLHAIKKPNVKQYQDEFMQMKENFSESWKRQISQQTRY